MFDGVIGKIIQFWLFMIGAAFILKLLGYAEDSKTTIIYLLACAAAYVVWVLGRTMARKRRER